MINTALSVSRIDVNNAINGGGGFTALSDGDTCIIPAGTDTTTWTSTVTVTKGIKVIGSATAAPPAGTAGIGTIATHISGATGLGATPLLQFNIPKTSFVDISGLDLRPATTGLLGCIVIGVTNSGGYAPVCYRIHNCSFNRYDSSGNGSRVIYTNDAYGLIDHIKVYETGSSSAASGIFNFEGLGDTMLSNNWHIPQAWGDENSNFIEDSIVICVGGSDSLVDGNVGGKAVMRYCDITNAGAFGNHGFDSAARSMLMEEFYQNTITDTANLGSTYNALESRGGSILAHDNTWIFSSGTRRSNFFVVRYYSVASDGYVGTNAVFPYRVRPTAVYPSGTWGTNPVTSISSITGFVGNNVSGSNKIDGNFTPSADLLGNTSSLNHMDGATSTKYTDVTMTSGSTSISSTTAAFSSTNFTNRDQYRMVIGPNVAGARFVSDGVISSLNQYSSVSSPPITGDVGRIISVLNQNAAATITSVAGGVATISPSLTNGTGLTVRTSGAWIVSESSGTATLNCPVTGSNTGNGVLVIGYTDTGYPVLDQPGFGPFLSSNAGSWPTATSYSSAHYEQQNPIFQWNNNFYGNSSPTIITGYPGNEAYIKVNREYYNRAPQAGDAIYPYTPYTYPHPLNIANTAPTITSANSVTWGINVAHSFTVTTTGTPTPSLSQSGAIPGWETFTDNGDGTATIAGTPTTIVGQPWAFTITAHNSQSPDATQTFTINLNQPATYAINIITPTVSILHTICGTQAIAGLNIQSSGSSPLTINSFSGLPTGTSISPTSDVIPAGQTHSFIIYWVPNVAQNSTNHTITVNCSNSPTGTNTFTLTQSSQRKPKLRGGTLQ